MLTTGFQWVGGFDTSSKVNPAFYFDALAGGHNIKWDRNGSKWA